MAVVGLDGDTIGEIIKIDVDFLLVKEDGAFPNEFQVPVNAVAKVEGDTVHLSVTKDDARDQRWPGTPAAEA